MSTSSYNLDILAVVVFAVAVASAFGAELSDANAMGEQIQSALREDVSGALSTIAAELRINPEGTIDRLNEQWMIPLLQAEQYDAMLEFSTAGALALPADTWRIEQLLRHRIRALLQMNRAKEALADAKSLYNISGIGFMPTAMDLVAECLKAAHPEDPGIASRFRLQQLAGAQTDAKEREKAMKDLGESILAGIHIDPTPWEKAIEDRKGMRQYRELYGTANLLLLADRTKEAREMFEKVYAIAPPGEIRYASEGLAKSMKAEDGFIGRANAWILSIRPKE